MFEVLINIIFWLVNNLYNTLIAPILHGVLALFPDLDTLIDNVQYFLATYVFPTLQWTKMFLLNVTAFPQELFTFICGLFLIMVSIHAALTLAEFIINIYNKFKP